MADRILKYLIKAMNYSKRAVMGFKINSNTPFLSNEKAIKVFGDEKGVIQIDKIFVAQEVSEYWKKTITEQLVQDGSVYIYDIVVAINDGTSKVADLQLGYADENQKIMFAEFYIKDDVRMAQALSQVNLSSRAEGILDFDEKLTLIHGNDLFHAVFDSSEEIAKSHYGNFFSNGFLEEVREELLSEIRENLARFPNYTTKLKVITAKNEEKWYRMELQRRTLDDSGRDKLMAYLVNIESEVEIETKLDTVSQYFEAIQSLSDDMLYRVDLSTKTLYRTSEQAEMLGISAVMENYPQSVLKTGLIHPEDEQNYLVYGENLLQGVATQVEVRMKLNDGSYEFRRLTCSPVRGSDGSVKEMFGKIVNIQMVRALEEQANYDALTKLLNKRAMLEATSSTLHKATQNDKHALFFMDLDDFKYVNDNLGHAFGDFLLAEQGKRLRESVRNHDLVGRVGGDEFVVFLRDVPSVEVALGKAKMILSTISNEFFDGTTRHTIHGSLGIALFPDHGLSYEELYHHADLALYSSKHKGKNQVTLYSEGLDQEN